jgi:hypothetical protein
LLTPLVNNFKHAINQLFISSVYETEQQRNLSDFLAQKYRLIYFIDYKQFFDVFFNTFVSASGVKPIHSNGQGTYIITNPLKAKVMGKPIFDDLRYDQQSFE